MFKTKKADWYFIIPASLIWISALIVTAWDFILIQKSIYHFDFINFVGFGSMRIGVLIRIWARKTLGGYFSYGLGLSENHNLIKRGIYKHLRHPSYSGSFLFSFGIPLLFSSSYGFLVKLLFIPCFIYRITIEENMLIERFGKEYINYMKHSKRLIPCIY